MEQNAKHPFSETLLLFMVYWYQTDLTLVVSSLSAGTSMVFVGFLLHAWPLLSSRHFLGVPIGCLTVSHFPWI